MTLDLRIVLVAESTPPFVDQLRLCLWSIRRSAGRFAEAPVHVVFNERADARVTEEIQRRFQVHTTIGPRLSRSLRFTNRWNMFGAPGLHEADWVLQLDCDTVVTAALDPLADLLKHTKTDFIAAPEVKRQAWGCARLFAWASGRSRREIDDYRDASFPSDGYPVFNNGVFLIRGSRFKEFGRAVLPMTRHLYRKMRGTTWNPLQWAKIQWNRRFWKRPDAARFILGPYFPRVHTNQIAVPATLMKLGMRYALLPEEFHWREPGLPSGRTVRVLHYLGSVFPIGGKGRILDGVWIPRFMASDQPCWRLLAEQASRYLKENQERPAPGSLRAQHPERQASGVA